MRILIFLTIFRACYSVLQFPDYKTHPCKRQCDGTTKICEYNFTIEYMFTMESNHCKNCSTSNEDCYRPHCVVGDGQKTMINTINRQIPSPPIEVCKGDQIKVNVNNQLPDVSVTIHWHGQHQKETPFMDGVPMVTQCVINPATTFQYHFRASQTGTQFYHSHSGFQRSNGIFGSLVVKEADCNNKFKKLYDYDLSEHVIVVNDWISDNPTEYYYRSQRLGSTVVPLTLLINGVGCHRFSEFPAPPIFNVKKGFRYRFRLINAGTLPCSITLSIQDHNLTVVSVDGNDINPVVVDKVTVVNGERVDFIISADKEVNYYWMSFKGGYVCGALTGLTVLSYNDKLYVNMSTYTPTERTLEFNCINKHSNTENCISYMNITSIHKMEPELKKKPTFKYYVGFNMERYLTSAFKDTSSSARATPAFNNITFNMPPKNLLDSNPNEIDFCNIENLKGCPKKPCECVHVIKIPYKAIVELILISERVGSSYHPMHLHGYSFRVIANEKLDYPTNVSEIKHLDRMGLLKRNFNNPPIKDVLTPPAQGYSIIRFKADNKGYWLLHCHIETHMELGMAMVFKVGDPPKPPSSFPKCGNYYSDYCIEY